MGRDRRRGDGREGKERCERNGGNEWRDGQVNGKDVKNSRIGKGGEEGEEVRGLLGRIKHWR